MERERVKPLSVTNEETGKRYTLEFSRETIVAAETAGLDMFNAEKKPMTMLTLLWCFAFQMHHPEVTPKEANDMLNKTAVSREALAKRLAALYKAGAESLCDENPKVTVVL